MKRLHHSSHKSKKNVYHKLLLLMGITIAMIAAIFIGFQLMEKDTKIVYGNLEGRFSRNNVVFHEQEYEPKSGLTTFLFIGVDQRQDAQEYNGPYRSGGQSDFLLLTVIDPHAKTVDRIQIDRDTMAEITVLGVLGKELGTNTHQICLAHGFGDGKEQSCRYTVEAVQRLLCGIHIDGYYAMNMDGILELNELLGGVTVQIEDDFSQLDASMTPGTSVKLSQEQAELFVRSRMSIGDGTNVSRMRRQKEFLNNALEAALDQIKANSQFLETLTDGLKNYTITNISQGRMMNEGNRAAKFVMNDIITPACQIPLHRIRKVK